MLRTCDMEKFSQLSENSKVWIYTSDRAFTADEIAEIRKDLDAFTKEWAAHGSQLKAAGDVLEGRYIVIVADETQTGASGCSIDTSVKFVRAIEQQYNVNLFDRMYFYSVDGTKIHFSDLVSSELKVYNSMITNLGELRTNWLLDAQELIARR